jgi:hypothetical protein
VIGDVRPQEHQVQNQPSSSMMVQSPTQDEEYVPQNDGRLRASREDDGYPRLSWVPEGLPQDDSCPRASRVPKRMDQRGSREQEEKEEEELPHAPPTQVRANIQRNHLVDQIFRDINKGVTTRSHIANFCEHYSFVSSIEPFRV